MSQQDQKRIYKMFKQKPISYNSGLAKALGSVEAAILIGQLLYWQGYGKSKDAVYKSIHEMKKETGLTRSQQDRVIKHCSTLGVLQVKLKGIPATRHFHVNIQKLEQFIQTSLLKSDKLAGLITTNSVAENDQSNTKINQRNTTEGYKKFKEQGEALKRRIGV